MNSLSIFHQGARLVLNPLLLFGAVLLVGLVFYFRGSKKMGYWLIGSSLFWLFLISTSPLPAFLSEQRENRYPQVGEVASQQLEWSQIEHVVVLGAGHTNAPGFTVQNRLSEPALKRLLEGIRLQQPLPQAKLVCSGYSSTGRQSQAEALAELAIQLGVNPLDTLLQPLAVNTEAEARTYAERFGKDHRFILVTSALHMPRAVYWFRYYGLSPIPAPTNHLVMPDPGHEGPSWKPSTRKIEMTQKLLHEYAGMLYAKWRTRGSRK